MRSKVVSLYDYKKIDLSEFQVEFKVQENRILDEMNRLVNQKSKWKDGEEISAGDMVELSLSSDVEKYNRPKLLLAVGSNLFDKELEGALPGKKKGDRFSLSVSAGEVEVTVVSVKNKIISELTDQIVADWGPEGVSTVAEFREFLIDEQKKEVLNKVSYQAEQKLIQELFDNSEFIIDRKDYDYCLNLQLDRNRAIAQTEGYKLEEMTREDFMGKIPVGSYWELVALVHDGNWGYLQSTLVGKYFAETTGEKIDLSQEAYDQLIQDYMEYWKSSEEDARKINTYDAFCMEQYQSCFYRILRSYYKNCLLKEEN